MNDLMKRFDAQILHYFTHSLCFHLVLSTTYTRHKSESFIIMQHLSYIKDIHWPVSQVYCQNTVILANHIIANDSW